MTDNQFFLILYSFIQGITEFIPISSSGHLNILESVFAGNNERNFLYETTVHFSSLLALLLYLFKNQHFEINNIKLNFYPILLGTVPAGIVGFMILHLDMSIINLEVIAYTSIFGGLMLYLSDIKRLQKIKINNKNLRFLFAGLFQCLAFLPGFSRSGSCIIAFRLMGEERKSSSIYSLYLGIPIIALSFLSNIKDFKIIYLDFNLLIIFIITFFSAYLTLIFFIRFINKISFTPFVIYRILLGLIILFFFN
tara:strand:- start:11217 stop:11972 length:756 start_codon:yes stop_codon:yes gene_type:complete